MSIVRLLSTLAGLLALVSATACYENTSAYCEDRAYHNCDNPSGTFPCKTGSDCSEQEGKPSCTEPDADGFGVCVQCTPADATACAATTPVCGIDNTCRACTKHADCASAVCLADGSCASENAVAYVAANGAGTTCTKAAPCGTLAAAVTTGRAVIKVAAGLVKSSQATIIDGKTLTIVAEEGAKLDRDTEDGPVLRVQGRSDVKIYDLEVTGASGTGANGIDLDPNGGAPKLALTRVKLTGHQGLGLSVQGGAVTISQSTISANGGGGISISSATFDITNSFIYRNGNQDTSTLGGLNLGVATANGNRLEFNTIVDNRAAVNSGGVVCNVPTFTGANNIIARNTLAGSATTAGAQTSGACTYPTSLIQNDVAGLMFEHPEPPAPFSYKLLAGSSAIDQATTASMVVIDADGEARPQGAQKDIGADEYKAN